MAKRNILVIGGGGREHALLWKLAQSPNAGKLYIASGNAGTAALAENVAIGVTDVDGLLKFAQDKQIGLTVVGMDDALAAGVVDAFRAAGLRIFGPTQAAAQIESSKAFSKELMKQTGVPTAQFANFSDQEDALDYVKDRPTPLVVKASGLARGKGVYICQTADEATAAVKEIMGQKVFGAAGNEVVIEEFLVGQEISIHALCDGTTARLFPSSQDHKTIFDGDKGPNTGGMGTIAPVPWVKPEVMNEVQKQVVDPILRGLAEANAKFVGCLYPGLMITKDGPKTLEYNARFGDPEAQVYMRLLESDLIEVIEACVDGTLDQIDLKWKPGYAVCIAAASGGYPDDYKTGLEISGIEQAEEQADVVVFHAGTKLEGDRLVTNGGRVLGVTATGATLQEALDKAYKAIELIKFEGMQYRSDIGKKSLSVEHA